MDAGTPATYAIDCSFSSNIGSGSLDTAQHKARLSVNPYTPPTSIEKATDLKGPHRLILGFTEQFRRYGLACLDNEQRIRIPRLPLTRTEVGDMLRTRMEQDEQETFQQLMQHKSEPAWIICRLKITRSIVRAVLDELRENRAAHANFVSILAATRFKYASKTGLVPARCRQLSASSRML